jgi:hypothetical protein
MGVGDWLSKGGSRPDEKPGAAHPLSTEEGIRALQKALAGAQPATLLEQVCDALEAGVDAGLDAPALRRALRLLDGGAQRTVAELLQAVLRGTQGGQIPELPAAAVVKYCRRIGALCETVLESDAAIAARAMNAWALRKKLLRMSYRFPDEELWAAGNRLYQRAQKSGLRDTEAVLGAGGATTPRRERLAGLMLDMAPHASLSPVQMECLDLLLRQFAASFVERDAPAPEAPFYVDLARPQPPQRWLPGLPARATMRFFGPGDCAAKIAALAAAAADPVGAQPLPAWAAPSGCTPEAYRLMLGLLARHWSDKPPQRRERRVVANSNVFLANGFEDVRRAVEASEAALKLEREGAPDLKGELMRDDKYFDRIRFGSVNPDKTTTGKLLRRQLVVPKQVLEKRERGEGRPAPETSLVADQSESGIGIALHGRAPWARVGVLVGYRAPDSLQWEVAVLRRLVRGVRLSLGLERIRGAAATAKLTPISGALSACNAMLFAEPLNQVLVPEGVCAEGDTFKVETEAGPFACRIGRVLEKGPDFLRAEYVKTPA